MESLEKIITQTFCSSTGKHGLKPQYILGCWLSKTTDRNKTHRFQYSPSLNEIFISESNIIQRWYVSNIDINSITCIADSSDTRQAFPLDCIPVEKKEKKFIINYKHHISHQFPQRSQHFEDYIQMQEEWVKKMIYHYRQNVLEEILLTHIHLKSSLLIVKGKRKSGGG